MIYLIAVRSQMILLPSQFRYFTAQRLQNQMFLFENECGLSETQVFFRKRKFFFTQSTFKAGLTLNDLYDTTCMTHNRFSNFNLRLHYHTSCSYRVHKSCSYKVFSLQEFKQNDSRTSCSSSNYCTNFREKQVKKKQKKRKPV